MIADYEREDWQDSPLIETLARIAAFLEAQGCEIPVTILDVLRTASEAGRPVAVALTNPSLLHATQVSARFQCGRTLRAPHANETLNAPIPTADDEHGGSG